MFYLDYAIVPMYLMFLCLCLTLNMFHRCYNYHATFITLYFIDEVICIIIFGNRIHQSTSTILLVL